MTINVTERTVGLWFVTIPNGDWMAGIEALELALADSGHPDARLVHALVTSSFTGETIQHAWCEVPAIGTYEDGSQGPLTVAIDHTQIDPRARIYPAHLLYEQTAARNLKRFTMAEAVVQALAAGHDGPWPCSPSGDSNLSIGSALSDSAESDANA